MTFKEKIHQQILPAIDKMIIKERDHLEWLLKQPLTPHYMDFITTSKSVLAHLEQRRIEYEEYAQTCKF